MAVTWHRGHFPMRACRDLRDYEPELLAAKFKFALKYKPSNEVGALLKSLVGGPGKLFLCSAKDAHRVHEYDMGAWIRPEHRSSRVLVNDLRNALSSYFAEVLEFSEPLRARYMPSVDTLADNMTISTLESPPMAEKLNLIIAFDPNLSFAMHSLGFQDDKRGWWKILWPRDRADLLAGYSASWDELIAKARYPIEKLPSKGELAPFVYSTEIHGGLWSGDPWSLPESQYASSLEDQVIYYLKNWLFKMLSRWSGGSYGFTPEITAKYVDSQIDPSVRLLYLDFRLNRLQRAENMAISIAPALRELFNWSETTLDPAMVNTVVLDRTFTTPEFVADYRARAPPFYDTLRRKNLISRASLFHTEWVGDTVSTIGSEPTQDPSAITTDYSFYFPHKTGRTFIVSNGQYCEPARNSYGNVCAFPKAKFDLSALVATRNDGTILARHHSFDLASTRIHIRAQVLNSDMTSLKAKTGLRVLNVPFGVSLIKNVVLKVGDTILEESFGEYCVRDKILSKLITSTHGDRINPSAFKHNAGIYRASTPFDVIITPFKLNTVPREHILTQLPLTIVVEFAPADNFVVPTTAGSYFRLNLLEVKVELVAAPFTSEIVENFSFIRNHNIPHYSFTQWKVGTATLKKGSMEIKTPPLVHCPNAKRFIVALGKKRDAGEDGWMDFTPLDLVRAVVQLSDDSPASKPIFYLQQQQQNDVPVEELVENADCTPFKCYLNQLRDSPMGGMNIQEFRKTSFLLCFDHTYPAARVPVGGKKGDFCVNALFAKPLPYDVSLYFLAEVYCELEVGFTGKVMSFREMEPVKAMEDDTSAGDVLNRRKRNHLADDNGVFSAGLIMGEATHPLVYKQPRLTMDEGTQEEK